MLSSLKHEISFSVFLIQGLFDQNSFFIPGEISEMINIRVDEDFFCWFLTDGIPSVLFSRFSTVALNAKAY